MGEGEQRPGTGEVGAEEVEFGDDEEDGDG